MLQTLMPWITTLTGTLLGGGILVPAVQHLLKRQDQSARRMMDDVGMRMTSRHILTAVESRNTYG